MKGLILPSATSNIPPSVKRFILVAELPKKTSSVGVLSKSQTTTETPLHTATRKISVDGTLDCLPHYRLPSGLKLKQRTALHERIA